MAVSYERARVPSVKKLGFWLVLLLAMFVALQLSSLAGLFLLARIKHITYDPMPATTLSQPQRRKLENLLAGRTRYLIHSPLLGWTIQPNRRVSLYRANSEGIRADRDYPLTPLEGVLRIATFGDSFMHGSDVKNEDTWQEVMMRAHRNVEVLNFGVGGFGTDQAFLRYQKDGAKYRPDIVMIGFFSDNIYRNVNVFRPFYTVGTDIPLAKPRYILEDGRLVLLPNPLPELSQYANLLANPAPVLAALGRHDYFFHSRYHAGGLAFLPSVRLFQVVRNRLQQRGTAIVNEKTGYYNVDSEAFKVTAAVIDEFVDAVHHAGSMPIIVVMPSAWDIEQHRREDTSVYAPLLAHFRTEGYRYVDLAEGFEESGKGVPVGELAPNHYSPEGNRLVAKVLWEYLEENRLVDPKTLRAH